MYCNSLLIALEEEETVEEFEVFEEDSGGKLQKKRKDLLRQIVRDRRIQGHGRMQYIVGSYFRTRTFQFMYGFSRNEFRQGEGFSRLFVQPIQAFHIFFVLPWVFIDLIDSVIFRLIYTKYCPLCGWKYYKTDSRGGHDAKECDYCREYSLIIDDILSGRITQSERIFKKRAMERVAEGSRSPYDDLCCQRKLVFSIMDVICIWFSMTLLLSILVLGLWPIVKFIAEGLELPLMDLR